MGCAHRSTAFAPGMSITLAVLLTLALGLLLPFPLYALSMHLRSARAIKPVDGQRVPSMSVIVVARDASGLIARKLNNLLDQDYPADRLEILVYTDGCSDDTAELARAASDRIRVIEAHQGLGKIHGMNHAAQEANGELLVFTDADATLSPGALRRLAAYFADPAIGGVCARRVVRTKAHFGLQQSQRDYIDLDSRIKLAENGMGSISSNDGKLYAMRAALYSPLPDAVTDDLYTAMQVVRQGSRFVFAPEIEVRVDLPSKSLAHELDRRRRIVSTSLRGIWHMRTLLNPFLYGGYAARLFINKVMRRLMPLGLIPLGAAAALLAPWAVLIAALGAAAALLARDCITSAAVARALDRIAYPATGLFGTLVGLFDLARGKSPTRWKPRGQDAYGSDPNRPRIAYTMSRFPKVTETFVLYEIMQMQRTGMDVHIFPLLLEQENTHHPEVTELMPRVRFAPFISLAVLQANLCWLTGSPWRYLGAWASALRSAWPNRNFLVGALGVLPKAALYARQMRTLQINHLHAHFATHAALAARFIHTLSGIPYSFTAHGHDIHISLQGFDVKARAARFWVTISRYNLQLIRDAFGPALLENAHRVHCGIDLERVGFHPPRADQKPFRILCVASFKEVKGHRYLIEACATLARQGVDFHCDLIGDGPLRQAIREQISTAGLEHRFSLAGQQPQPAVLEAMRACHVVVLPSILASRGDREGIPVCLMEAMATGRPVISTQLSGIPELVTSGKEGILVTQKSSAALAQALLELAQDPQKQACMGRAGRTKVARDFDLVANAAALAGLIRQSLREGREQAGLVQGEASTRKAS